MALSAFADKAVPPDEQTLAQALGPAQQSWNELLTQLALGERAVAAAHDRALPPIVLDTIDTAPRYAEGRGVRIVVRGVDELPAIQELALIKLGRTPA